jgi:hypothetical protein
MAEFYEYASYILVFDGVTRDDLNSWPSLGCEGRVNVDGGRPQIAAVGR